MRKMGRDRETAFILKRWELKLRSFNINGRKGKTKNASWIYSMASPSISLP